MLQLIKQLIYRDMSIILVLPNLLLVIFAAVILWGLRGIFYAVSVLISVTVCFLGFLYLLPLHLHNTLNPNPANVKPGPSGDN